MRTRTQVWPTAELRRGAFGLRSAGLGRPRSPPPAPHSPGASASIPSSALRPQPDTVFPMPDAHSRQQATSPPTAPTHSPRSEGFPSPRRGPGSGQGHTGTETDRQTALPSRTSKTNRGDAHSRVITQTRDHELRPEQRRRTGWQQREPRGLGRGAFRKTATPGLPPEGCERAGRGRQEEQEERDEGRPRARKRKQLVWLGTPRKREVGGDETAGGTGAWAAAAGILDSILSVAEGLGAGR